MGVDLTKLLLWDDRSMFCRIDEPVKVKLANIDRVVKEILNRRLDPGMIVLRLHTETVQFMRDPG